MTQATVHVLATGGTIAGVAASSTAQDYVAGSASIQSLLDGMPELVNLAQLTSEQVFNIDSVNMTEARWLILHKAVNQALARPEVSGVVITHGTDTLEETAYFLDLLHTSPKPLVLVGSMRSSSALSADGPMNLYNAIALTQDASAVGRGVLVVMNDQIMNARQVTKFCSSGLDAFVAKDGSPLGRVSFGKVHWRDGGRNLASQRLSSGLSLKETDQLPKVALQFCHVGFDVAWLSAMLDHDAPQGLILAGTGAGNLPETLDAVLKKAKQKGVVVVRSTRLPSGAVTPNYNNLDTKYGLIHSGYLSAVKSRILLMLALLQTRDHLALQTLFDQQGV
jgi:L-asparaginase